MKPASSGCILVGLDLAELEGYALALYQELGIDPAEPVTTFRLARAWLGPGTLERVANLTTPAKTYRVGGRDRIAVRSSVPIEYAAFFVGHELAHLLLRRAGYIGDDEEACADYLSAAVMMPREFVLAIDRSDGFAPRIVAELVGCTETAYALRYGEVKRVPLAAVSPGAVRVRGPEAFIWPEERTIRSWAQKPGPGLARVRLTDQPRRVALLADEDVA